MWDSGPSLCGQESPACGLPMCDVSALSYSLRIHCKFVKQRLVELSF